VGAPPDDDVDEEDDIIYMKYATQKIASLAVPTIWDGTASQYNVTVTVSLLGMGANA